MTAADDGTTLQHLQGPAAAVRQVIAGHALGGLEHVIEIGGAGLPITRFLRPIPRSVTVIDPKITPYEAETLEGQPCRVRHIARKFQASAVDIPTGRLGVAMIGLSLKGLGTQPAVTEALVELCRRAERVVIEHSLTLDRALGQLPDIVREARLETIWSVKLELADGVIEAAGQGLRQLLVLRPAD